MAEGGIVERFFGGGEGEDGGEVETGLGGLDPVAAGVATRSSGRGEPLDPRLATYLEKQAHLVGVQTEHLHEQREVQLSHLKLRRMTERMRVMLQAFLVAVGALLGVGFVWMVSTAVNDRGLVVEAFSVPPDLAQRGLTGQVVAQQVLDRLASLQRETVTMRAPDSYRNNWGDDLKVEIPETGVSIAEVRRYLRETFGHATRISGEVYRTDAGLTVTARAGEEAVKSLSGPEADFDRLLDQAAEALFARTQPYRYATYLRRHDRLVEAEAAFRAIMTGTSPRERAWAHLGLGYLFGARNDFQADEAQLKAALMDDPGFVTALALLGNAERKLEHDAQALGYARSLLRSRDRIGDDVNDADREFLIALAKSEVAEITGDYRKETEAAEPLLASASAQNREDGWRLRAEGLTMQHDYAGARAALAHISADQQPGVNAYIAVRAGDPSAVALQRQMIAEDEAQGGGQDYVARNDLPWLALALARSGDLKGAQAAIASTPLDCDACLRVRGTVAGYAGDRPASERWFSEAIARAPGLPDAIVERGYARFRRGDLDGALADAGEVARLSPNDPDGPALSGDVMARRGRWADARDRYDEALRLAPSWQAARRARDEVARRA